MAKKKIFGNSVRIANIPKSGDLGKQMKLIRRFNGVPVLTSPFAQVGTSMALCAIFGTPLCASANSAAVKRVQPATQVFLDAVVLTSDVANNKIIVKAKDKSVSVLLSSDTRVVTKKEGFEAGALQVGDSVEMFEKGQRRNENSNENNYAGRVSSTSPLAFGSQVTMTKFPYKEGTTRIGDFATKTTAKATIVYSHWPGTQLTKQVPYLTYVQTITFTVLKPEKVQFTRVTPLKLTDININQHILIYAKNVEGTNKAVTIWIVPEKARPAHKE